MADIEQKYTYSATFQQGEGLTASRVTVNMADEWLIIDMSYLGNRGTRSVGICREKVAELKGILEEMLRLDAEMRK